MEFVEFAPAAIRAASSLVLRRRGQLEPGRLVFVELALRIRQRRPDRCELTMVRLPDELRGELVDALLAP